MCMKENNNEVSPDSHAVLTEALMNAARIMGLDDDRMARLLELDPTTVGHLFKGTIFINKDCEKGKLALRLIELYLSTHSITGSEENLRHWLHTDNRHLHGKPADLIMTGPGLNTVLNYLERINSK